MASRSSRLMCKRRSIILLIALLCFSASHSVISQTIKIGSKTFNESHILAEMAALLLEQNGFEVERRLGLGGTLIAYEALQNADIDLYPEYTGTITQVILKNTEDKSTTSSWGDINSHLKDLQLQLLPPLGFNNSYALAISQPIAESLKLSTISDFAKHPDLNLGVSLEFLNREDGWPSFSQAYQLQQDVIGIEHALAYQAIANGDIAATDAYTTDGDIQAYPLVLLEDDKQFFPEYLAAFLSRDNLPEAVAEVLNQLSGKIDEQTMRDLTARVSLDKQSPAEVAEDFLLQQQLIQFTSERKHWLSYIAQQTLIHLQLTAIALLLAIIIAIPGALLLSKYASTAKALLYVTGLFQTIPSLALLALLIPLVGLGKAPAIIALFLYSLLPIFRNTLTGLMTVDPMLKQVALGMGLSTRQQLLKIELPLAAPTIIAGIKTAAIISIGTATLAAFVGAGGLGEPIITGLTLNNHSLILQGAIPAAILAILVELLFERLEAKATPAHYSPQQTH